MRVENGKSSALSHARDRRMKKKDLHLNLWDLVSSLAKTFDMMSPAVADHCQRVAYLALRLGEELNLPPEEMRDIIVAGALHDIGAFSLNERLDILAFETNEPERHALAGFLLLKDVPLFSRASSLVRFHHLPWREGEGAAWNGNPVPRSSHILHLADRVAVVISKGPAVLGQVEGICETVSRHRGDLFVPEHADAMLRIAKKDFVWLDIASQTMDTALGKRLKDQTVELDVASMLALSRLICRIIDFKSEFTATHSSGVAASGRELARLAGFSRHKCRMFEIAAYLHDLGKLAVPSEILEKPGKLSTDEWQVMRTHVYYTYQILSPIKAFEDIASWGCRRGRIYGGHGGPSVPEGYGQGRCHPGTSRYGIPGKAGWGAGGSFGRELRRYRPPPCEVPGEGRGGVREIPGGASLVPSSNPKNPLLGKGGILQFESCGSDQWEREKSMVDRDFFASCGNAGMLV
jgi:HD-GYP domain-containing protein (c-di-GMP phosphodiesterase class II)